MKTRRPSFLSLFFLGLVWNLKYLDEKKILWIFFPVFLLWQPVTIAFKKVSGVDYDFLLKVNRFHNQEWLRELLEDNHPDEVVVCRSLSRQ